MCLISFVRNQNFNYVYLFLIIFFISFLMLSPSESRTIVIDNGSMTCKAGFAGEQIPKYIINSFVGKDIKTNEIYIGNDAYLKADHLILNYPIDHQIITNWEDMERIWSYIFHNEFKVDPSNHSVLLTDDPLNTKENREKMIQIMFETFNVSSFYVAKRPVLSLYSSGRLNGIVINSGDSTSSVTPIIGGYYVNNTAIQSNIAGKSVTTRLQQLLNERGHKFESFSEFEIVRAIKEKVCYISSDFENENNKSEKLLDYSIPNGISIKIGKEIFQCAEVLFNPQINGFNSRGIIDIFNESIHKCDAKYHNDLYSNIVISGGTTKLNNFYERIEQEIKAHAPTAEKINIIKPHKRQFSAWIGGSTLASLPTFKDMMVQRQEYKESGAGIVNKCP